MTTGDVLNASRPPANSIAEHVRRTLQLAFPVILARAGIIVLIAVDVAMTGHLGAVELAYYGLAIAPQIPMMLVGMGLLMGTVVLVAQADGAGERRTAGAVWRVALVQGVVYGAILMALSHGGEWLLAALGQAPDLAAGGGRVLVMMGWGMPAILLFLATTLFLEGISRPAAALGIMVIANALNAVLNWMLIYGNAGLPAMGAEGAALATTIVRWFMFVALGIYALTRVDRVRYGITGRIEDARAIARKLRRLGYPIGLGLGIETGAFSSLTLFAGLMGPAQIAAYQIAMNIVAVVFMCAIGFSTAGGVRVGNAIGRGDAAGTRIAGWVSIWLTVLAMATFGALFYTFPGSLVAIYTNDAGVAAIAVPTVIVAALVVVFDGTQAALGGVLRGAADVWPLPFIYFAAFWGFMVPLGYVMGVHGGQGVPGLMSAVGIGCATATLLLAARFHVVARRGVGRV
jgi:MATE family multidrug resistance protein